jgi:hypothetical protein
LDFDNFVDHISGFAFGGCLFLELGRDTVAFVGRNIVDTDV